MRRKPLESRSARLTSIAEVSAFAAAKHSAIYEMLARSQPAGLCSRRMPKSTVAPPVYDCLRFLQLVTHPFSSIWKGGRRKNTPKPHCNSKSSWVVSGRYCWHVAKVPAVPEDVSGCLNLFRFHSNYDCVFVHPHLKIPPPLN
jgi:hypothetical protein